MSAAGALEQVVAELRAARKYQDVAPGVLARVAREALAIERRPADAVKRAKRKLHQIHAAFAPASRIARAARLAAELAAAAGPAGIDTLCARILACHASTSERPEDPGALYRELFALTGPPAVVLDLGCGLHPFALPFMGLGRDVPYHAVDLDLRMLALVETLFAKLGQRGSVAAADLLGDDPLPAADVALALKLLPTLERQSTGAAGRLLDRLDARVIVLSFATRSLGAGARRGPRRERPVPRAAPSTGVEPSSGMARHYTALAQDLLAPRGWPYRTLATRNEIFFVVERRGRGAAPPPSAGRRSG